MGAGGSATKGPIIAAMKSWVAAEKGSRNKSFIVGVGSRGERIGEEGNQNDGKTTKQ